MDSASEMLKSSAAGLPGFLLYLVTAIILLGLFAILYTAITPHREFRLLRQGNNAAALSLGGALIGFIIPLSEAVSQSANLIDLFLWGGVALAVQLLAYFLAAATIQGFAGRIVDGQIAVGLYAATLSIGLGLLNAAAMSFGG